ncbi:unknown [Parabacteroides sp. CAG:409]|nr:unknown [Parabacteroides sp. CAG:409]
MTSAIFSPAATCCPGVTFTKLSCPSIGERTTKSSIRCRLRINFFSSRSRSFCNNSFRITVMEESLWRLFNFRRVDSVLYRYSSSDTSSWALLRIPIAYSSFSSEKLFRILFNSYSASNVCCFKVRLFCSISRAFS